jgi:hypothetical protein
VLRFLLAGIFAGCLQVLIVSGASVTAILRVGVDQFAPSAGDKATDAFAVGASTLIAWSDILIAACVSMIRTRHVDTTAVRLRDGFRQVSPRDPDRAASSLLVQLYLAAMGFGLLALKTSPVYVFSIGSSLGNAGYGAIIWPATMSIGVAVFGASAHAALIARYLYSN